MGIVSWKRSKTRVIWEATTERDSEIWPYPRETGSAVCISVSSSEPLELYLAPTDWTPEGWTESQPQPQHGKAEPQEAFDSARGSGKMVVYSYDDQGQMWIHTDREHLLDRIRKLEGALQWCSGSADFGHGGIAEKGWRELCAPLIYDPPSAMMPETEPQEPLRPDREQPSHASDDPAVDFEPIRRQRFTLRAADATNAQIEAGVAAIPAYLRAGLHGLLKQHHPDENTEQIEARLRDLVRIVLEAGR